MDFIYKITNTKLEVDKKKLNNVLSTTSFEYLQKLEKENNFPEAIKTKDGNYATFFKYGKKNTGKNIPEEIKEKLESHFGLEKPLHTQYFLYLGNIYSNYFCNIPA